MEDTKEKVWDVLSMPAGCKLLEPDEDVMTIKSFTEYCDAGGFVNGDGMGSWATKNYYLPGNWIYPSEFTRGKKLEKPVWATHVVWYNK